MPIAACPHIEPLGLTAAWSGLAAAVGVITETNAEKAIEELKAYEVSSLNGGQLVVANLTCLSSAAHSSKHRFLHGRAVLQRLRPMLACTENSQKSSLLRLRRRTAQRCCGTGVWRWCRRHSWCLETLWRWLSVATCPQTCASLSACPRRCGMRQRQ